MCFTLCALSKHDKGVITTDVLFGNILETTWQQIVMWGIGGLLIYLAIAKQMEGVAAIEKQHEERYRALLKNIEDAKVFSRVGEQVWICRNCGHVHVGPNAPVVCPVCAHPQAYFELRSQNY